MVKVILRSSSFILSRLVLCLKVTVKILSEKRIEVQGDTVDLNNFIFADLVDVHLGEKGKRNTNSTKSFCHTDFGS